MGADIAAFDALLQLRSRPLLRAAYALTSDWGQAEDLLQTALTKTYLHWGALDDIGAGEAYLRRVMFTTYARWWRRKWRGETPTEALPEHAGHDDYADSDRRDALRRALATLPRRQRAILVLRFYEDMSETDVAETMGVSVGTVKSATSRALAKLRIRDDLQDTEPAQHSDASGHVIDLNPAPAATPFPTQRAAT